MSSDLLERATRALREESVPTADDLAETRARLLASSGTERARRATTLRWVLPLAAAFAAGTAFAATNGQLERAVRAVQTWWVEPPRASVDKPKPKHTRALRQVTPPDNPSPVPALEAQEPARDQNMVEPQITVLEPVKHAQVPAAEPVLAVTSTEHRSSRPRRPVRAEMDRPAVATSGSSSAPEETAGAAGADAPAEPSPPSPDLAFYREAHRAHFVARDYPAALTLWTRYLTDFPEGIFALEASYNRAICLVRLGRKSEAEKALRPFADGKVKNGYRRDEARALVDMLTKTP